MTLHSEHIGQHGTILTEQEKKSLGWDMRSFARRMNERLRKVRGEDENDSFLARHNYYKKSNSIT